MLRFFVYVILKSGVNVQGKRHAVVYVLLCTMKSVIEDFLLTKKSLILGISFVRNDKLMRNLNTPFLG